jgi:hypothetical protein
MLKKCYYLLIVAMLFSFTIAGCNNDDESGINPGTPCEEMIYDICEAACACADNCAWSAGTGLSSSSDFETCYEMEIQFGTCDDLTMDFDACSDQIPDGECADSTLGKRYELPASCEEISAF